MLRFCRAIFRDESITLPPCFNEVVQNFRSWDEKKLYTHQGEMEWY